MKKWLTLASLLVPAFLLFAACGGSAPAATVPTETQILPTDTFEPPTDIPTVTTAMPTPKPDIGSTPISDKDGMVMVPVPKGEFIMGSDYGPGDGDEKPAHKVTLDMYLIDQTEVTNAMYAKCVNDGACQPPSNTSSHKQPSYYGNSELADYPVIYVDWNMAKTYCEWAGRRLPTEAQWEKAARGAFARSFPWGDVESTTGRLNFNGLVGDTTQVGIYPKGVSPYHAYDMAGNVWEWVADWYSVSYYQHSPIFNPMGPDTGHYRVLRGGAWDSYNENLVICAHRLENMPTNTGNNIGFRCSLTP